MASYQRVALFILFDSIEADLLTHIRAICPGAIQLSQEEREKSVRRLAAKSEGTYNLNNDSDLLYGLDIAEKFQVLMRHKDGMDQSSRAYFQSLTPAMMKSVSVRNDIMHGRPLTLDEHVYALAFAQELLKRPGIWPRLSQNYREYTDNPAAILQRSIEFFDDEADLEVIHNLPVPDYDDTGFLSRSKLEADLKKKLLGRHPVVTILGEGGNGKTALALRVLYGLVSANDHDFDVIIWVTAKTSELQISGIKEIENVTTSAIDVMEQASFLEITGNNSRERLTNFLTQNKVLLVIDNYETIIGDEIAQFAEDVPGQSKLLFTSRRPVGSDLTVGVEPFSQAESRVYVRRLIEAYGVRSLSKMSQTRLDEYLSALSYKPLLIKWFVLGVQSGLQPDRIVANPDTALRFCLDNVVLALGPEAAAVSIVLATIPARTSAGAIAHIARLDATQVADGLAELSRVGLIDAASSEEGGQIFGITQFARSYIYRLIAPKKELTDKILSNYRGLEAEYQEQSAKPQPSLFRLSNIKVASRGQMLAAKELKLAASYSREGRDDLAESHLRTAKALEPTFFENHRIEALIALNQNDWSRAINAYETAIHLAPDEPQLHHFYAGLLMRMNENTRAAEEFEKAISLYGDDEMIFREAARNEMYRSNFDAAQQYIDRAVAAGNKVWGENIKLLDLQLQVHGRALEYKVRGGQLELALANVEALLSFLRSIDINTVDFTFAAHVRSYMPDLYFLKGKLGNSSVSDLIDFIKANFALTEDEEECDPTPVRGFLKQQGRKPRFGFIAANNGGRDTYVHASDVTPEIWDYMCKEGEVEFERGLGERGKACNVRKVTG